MFGELAKQRERDIEIAIDLHDARAHGDGLGELAAGDLSFRNDDQCLHAAGGGVGRERG